MRRIVPREREMTDRCAQLAHRQRKTHLVDVDRGRLEQLQTVEAPICPETPGTIEFRAEGRIADVKTAIAVIDVGVFRRAAPTDRHGRPLWSAEPRGVEDVQQD